LIFFWEALVKTLNSTYFCFKLEIRVFTLIINYLEKFEQMTFKNIIKYFKRKISRKILRKSSPPQNCTRILKVKEARGFQGANDKNYIFLSAYVEIELREFSSLSVMERTVKFRGKLTIKLPLYPPETKHHLQNQLKILLFNFYRW